jgi:hypothetical protein
VGSWLVEDCEDKKLQQSDLRVSFSLDVVVVAFMNTGVIFLLTMVLSVLHRYTTSGYLFCYFSVNHGVVCPSSIQKNNKRDNQKLYIDEGQTTP